jgi:hypothetical protein
MHIVVLNPYMDPEYGEEAIIFEFAVGDKTKWEHPYDEIARAKAFSAARHQMSTDTLRRLYPHLMQPEDTVHCGGVNFEGIPIGVSGVQGYFDELVANWLGATIVALCKARMAEILEDKSIDTLGQAQFVSK